MFLAIFALQSLTAMALCHIDQMKTASLPLLTFVPNPYPLKLHRMKNLPYPFLSSNFGSGKRVHKDHAALASVVKELGSVIQAHLS